MAFCGIIITLSVICGIRMLPVVPLWSMPLVLANSARTEAVPVVTSSTPETVDTFPVSG